MKPNSILVSFLKQSIRPSVCTLVCIVLFFCMTATAKKPPPELQPTVETSVDRSEITIGDDITYTVKITYDPSVTLEASTAGMELGQFEIKDVKIGVPQREGDRMVRTDRYILSTYFTGDYTIPPLTVRFRTPGGEVGEVSTDSIDIHVRSLTPEESEELTIRDIKPPVLVRGQSRWSLVAWAAGAVFVISVLVFWFVFLRRHEKVAVTLEPPLPPHERALTALQALRSNETLLAERRFKEFSTRLSEILRVYIHGRWGVVALDRTTDEILSELDREGVLPSVRERLAEVLGECDLMKFARHETDRENAYRLIDLSVRIVEETREEQVTVFGPEVPGSPVGTQPGESDDGVT